MGASARLYRPCSLHALRVASAAPSVESRTVWRSVSAFSLAPIKITMIDSHIHIMKPITAPSEPYVLLKLPKFAAYQENRPDAPSQTRAANALPQLIQLQRGFLRLGPYM